MNQRGKVWDKAWDSVVHIDPCDAHVPTGESPGQSMGTRALLLHDAPGFVPDFHPLEHEHHMGQRVKLT